MNMIRLALCVAGVSMAAVPHKFTAGAPAKADSVNANFDYLDNALKSKADTSALNAVKASIPSAVSLADYAKTTAVSDTAAKVRNLIPSVAGFATAKSLSDSATAIRSAIPSAVNLSNYATVPSLKDTATAIRASIPSAVSLSDYARTSAVSDTATKVRSMIPSVAGFATAKLLADTAAQIRAAIPSGVNLSGYATTAAVSDTATKIRGLIPSLTSYAKTTDLAVYAKTTALTDGLSKKVDLTALSDMATITWANKTFAPIAVSGDVGTLKTDLSAVANRTTALEGSVAKALVLDAANVASVPGDGKVVVGESGVFTGLGSNSIELSSGSPGGPISIGMTNNQGVFQLFLTDASSPILDASVNKVNIYGSLRVKGVTMTVPDYVFESNYQLTSLPEIEAFTKANKHLPEVPSAAEIEKGGLDLTQMNLTLLKKVEELTLHAIAQNKQLESQAAQIQAQNERLQALEASRN